MASAAMSRIPILHAANVYEALTGRVSLEHADKTAAGGFVPRGIYPAFKRMLDVLFVVVASPVILPVAALTAAAVRLDSSGPALFYQERVGRGGRVFRIAKFRSMTVAAPRTARFATDESSRITRVGTVIRRFRLDELPQFWNVLRGDMSLIGPRPEQTPFVESYSREIPLYPLRHAVRPGISGWAQVHQGYTADLDETRTKLQYDLYYVKHLSPWLDLLVAFQSLKAVVTGFGAR